MTISEQGQVVVRHFQDSAADRAAFKELNLAWIKLYFKVEEKDVSTLEHPEKILAEQGAILMAEIDGCVVGTCALMRHSAPVTLEIAKMAVDPSAQGKGVASKIMQGLIDYAKTLADIKRLYIETNSSLAPALALYKKFGFTHIPEERRDASPYERADTFLELMLE